MLRTNSKWLKFGGLGMSLLLCITALYPLSSSLGSLIKENPVFEQGITKWPDFNISISDPKFTLFTESIEQTEEKRKKNLFSSVFFSRAIGLDVYLSKNTSPRYGEEKMAHNRPEPFYIMYCNLKVYS